MPAKVTQRGKKKKSVAIGEVQVGHIEHRKGIVVWRKGDRVIAVKVEAFTSEGDPDLTLKEAAFIESLFVDPSPEDPPTYPDSMPVEYL